MALEGGSGIGGTGLAGEIAKARKSKFKAYDVSKDSTLDAEAKAIVDYFIANADLTVDPNSGEGGPTSGSGGIS